MLRAGIYRKPRPPQRRLKETDQIRGDACPVESTLPPVRSGVVSRYRRLYTGSMKLRLKLFISQIEEQRPVRRREGGHTVQEKYGPIEVLTFKVAEVSLHHERWQLNGHLFARASSRCKCGVLKTVCQYGPASFSNRLASTRHQGYSTVTIHLARRLVWLEEGNGVDTSPQQWHAVACLRLEENRHDTQCGLHRRGLEEFGRKQGGGLETCRNASLQKPTTGPREKGGPQPQFSRGQRSRHPEGQQRHRRLPVQILRNAVQRPL